MKVRAFHASQLGAAPERLAAGEALSAHLGQLMRAFNAASIPADRVESALRAIVETSQSERYTSYASAEQAIMAVDSLSRAMADQGGARRAKADRARGAIDAAYRTVGDPNTYDQEAFRRAIADIAQRLGS